MDDIRRAIEHSDYTVTLHARLQMLARAGTLCDSAGCNAYIRVARGIEERA